MCVHNLFCATYSFWQHKIHNKPSHNAGEARERERDREEEAVMPTERRRRRQSRTAAATAAIADFIFSCCRFEDKQNTRTTHKHTLVARTPSVCTNARDREMRTPRSSIICQRFSFVGFRVVIPLSICLVADDNKLVFETF